MSALQQEVYDLAKKLTAKDAEIKKYRDAAEFLGRANARDLAAKDRKIAALLEAHAEDKRLWEADMRALKLRVFGLEEHVARAVLDKFWECAQEQDWSAPASSAGRLRHAAIAAVREREGAESAPCPVDVCSNYGPCDQAEATGHCPYRDGEPTPDPAEAMRAKCEVIARFWNDTSVADRIAALKGKGEER